jgi:hypothetical protein
LQLAAKEFVLFVVSAALAADCFSITVLSTVMEKLFFSAFSVSLMSEANGR